MVACPYSVRTFNWFPAEDRWPPPLDQSINPSSMPLRPKGVVEKCIFCYHRLERLRSDLMEGRVPRVIANRLERKYQPGTQPSDEVWSRALDIVQRYFFEGEATPGNFDPRLVGYLPACVQVCPPRARVFGDLANPRSLVSHLANSPRAFHLLEEIGTDPSVVYLKPT